MLAFPDCYPDQLANLALRLAPARERAARAAVVDFVSERFYHYHGAYVTDDAPEWVGVYQTDGALAAGFALRNAASGLFCTRYLDAPLSELLAPALGADVSEVIEIAHLCALRPGALCAIVPIAAQALATAGFQAVVCTATARLAQYFVRKRLVSVDLGPADPHRLSASERAIWGRYYDTAPRVLAGALPARLRCTPAATPQCGTDRLETTAVTA